MNRRTEYYYPLAVRHPMAASATIPVRYVEDDSWRRSLCPDCGARLADLSAWRDHAPRHRWGSEWLAARVRAAMPGETIRLNPEMLGAALPVIAVQIVKNATWKSGIEA
jgi:hypothetical protein